MLTKYYINKAKNLMHFWTPTVRLHRDSFRELKGICAISLHFQAYTELASERQRVTCRSLRVISSCMDQDLFKELGGDIVANKISFTLMELTF